MCFEVNVCVCVGGISMDHANTTEQFRISAIMSNSCCTQHYKHKETTESDWTTFTKKSSALSSYQNTSIPPTPPPSPSHRQRPSWPQLLLLYSQVSTAHDRVASGRLSKPSSWMSPADFLSLVAHGSSFFVSSCYLLFLNSVFSPLFAYAIDFLFATLRARLHVFFFYFEAKAPGDFVSWLLGALSLFSPFGDAAIPVIREQGGLRGASFEQRVSRRSSEVTSVFWEVTFSL